MKKLLVFMISLCQLSAYAWGKEYISVHTLCKKGEQVLFSCPIQGASAKILSVCGSHDLGAKRGYIKYRFGKRETVELEYPKGNNKTQQAFLYTFSLSEEHIRQASEASLSFSRGKYLYEVYNSIFDAELFSNGVRVITPERTVTLECMAPIIGNLDKVGEVVPHGKP